MPAIPRPKPLDDKPFVAIRAHLWTIPVLLLTSTTLTAPATDATTRPARILPQNQQALLFFGIYKVATDNLAANGTLPDQLHQHLLQRIASGQADTEAFLAKAPPPADSPAGMQQSAQLAKEVSQRTRACLRDIKQLLTPEQFQSFDDRGRITMEEVFSLQVIKSDTDYSHRDLVASLHLTSDQQQRMDALLKSNHEKMLQFLKQYIYRPSDGRGSYLSTELAFQTRQKFRDILTPEQSTQWDQVILKRYGGK